MRKILKKIKKFISNSYLYKKFFVKSFKMAQAFSYYYEKKKILNNYVFYSSQCGKAWNGNPRAILDYLLNNEKYKDFHHVVLYDNLDDENVLKYKKKYKNIIFVKSNTRLYAKYAEMCQYLIVDNTLSPYFIKKDGQIYANSWHSTLLKPLGKHTGLIWESSNISKNCLQMDYFITPNKFTSDLFFKAYYSDTLFQGEVIDVGYPRNDMIYHADKEKIRKELCLSKNDKLIIYAPTWRGTIGNIEKQATELFDKFYQLKEGLKDEYVVLFRPHIMTYKYLKKEEKKYIVPMDIDTNELLAVTDILITDYSGIFFDFLNTRKPIILFPFDKEKYLGNRDSRSDFYLPLEDVPGPICYNVEELIDSIKNIEKISKKYSKKYKEYVEKFVGHDDGKATERVVAKIFNNKPTKIKRDKRKNILICPGNMNGNGVTESFLTLMDNIDYSKYNVSVLLESKSKNCDKQLEINEEANIFYRNPVFMYKNFLEYILVSLNFKIASRFLPVPKKFCQRNVRSRIYDTDFDVVIEYHGYNPTNAMLHSIGIKKSCKKIIYLHADMNLDRITKNKKIGRVFKFYKYYDKLVCVSKGSYEENLVGTKEYILKKYHVDLTDKFTYVYNLVNLNKIINGINKEVLKYQDDLYYYCDDNVGDMVNIIKLPKKNEIAFISIGRLSPEKNHKKIINAFSKLVKEYSNLKLYIVGEGPLKISLTKLITKLGLEERVTLTGYLKNPYFLLNYCDCFVFPSSYEGMGLSALEASILNKYVIASNIKSLSDFIDSSNGVLVEIKEQDIYEKMSDFIVNKKNVIAIDGEKFNKEALDLFYKTIK